MFCLNAFRCSAFIQFNIYHSDPLFETGERRLKFVSFLHTLSIYSAFWILQSLPIETRGLWRTRVIELPAREMQPLISTRVEHARRLILVLLKMGLAWTLSVSKHFIGIVDTLSKSFFLHEGYTAQNIFGLVQVEQIFTDLINAKQKFVFGASPTMPENENVWQRDLEVRKLYHYNVINKTWTFFFRLAVFVYMQSFKRFHSSIGKIFTIWQYVKKLWISYDVIDNLVWISHKSKYFKN